VSDLLSKSSPDRASLFLFIKVRQTVTVVVTLIHFQLSVVPQQLVHAASESKQDQRVDEEELDDVDDHSAERHLQWSHVWIDRKYVDQLEKREDHTGGESALRYQHGIELVPMFPWNIGIEAISLVTLEVHLTVKNEE
jgi:hypothetical protein